MKKQLRQTVPLKDTPDFVRDMNSGGIVLTSKEQLDKYQALKQKAKAEKEKMKALEDNLENLQTEVRDLRFALEKLLNNDKNK